MEDLDYQIGIKENSSMVGLSKTFTGLAALSRWLEKLDALMISDLSDGHISIDYTCQAGPVGGVKMGIRSCINYPDATLNEIKQYILNTRLITLKAISHIKNQDDFDCLHKNLISLGKEIGNKSKNLVMSLSTLSKENLAKIIVNLCIISASRHVKNKILYSDKENKIVFECENRITYEEILGKIKQDDTEYYGEFQIKKAPGDHETSFVLKYDGKIVRHRMCSKVFLREWFNGDHEFTCFSKMKAKFKIIKHHDQNLFELIEVLGIERPAKNENQLFLAY